MDEETRAEFKKLNQRFDTLENRLGRYERSEAERFEDVGKAIADGFAKMGGKLGGIAAKVEFLDELKGNLQAQRGLLAESTSKRAGVCLEDSLRAARRGCAGYRRWASAT